MLQQIHAQKRKNANCPPQRKYKQEAVSYLSNPLLNTSILRVPRLPLNLTVVCLQPLISKFFFFFTIGLQSCFQRKLYLLELFSFAYCWCMALTFASAASILGCRLFQTGNFNAQFLYDIYHIYNFCNLGSYSFYWTRLARFPEVKKDGNLLAGKLIQPVLKLLNEDSVEAVWVRSEFLGFLFCFAYQASAGRDPSKTLYLWFNYVFLLIKKRFFFKTYEG